MRLPATAPVTALWALARQANRAYFRRSFFVFTLNLTVGRFERVEIGALLRRRRRSHFASAENNFFASLKPASSDAA